jgi:outer membrane protein
MKKISIATLIMLSAYASSAEAYNVADAIKAARENNMQIKSKREDFKNAKTAKFQALTTVMPDVKATSGVGRAYLIPERGRLSNNDAAGINLTVTQPIFDGFKTYYTYDKAKNSIGSAEFTYKANKDSILFEVIRTYEEVIRTREVYEVNVTTHQVLIKHLKETQERFKLGEATVTDVAQAESRVAEALSNKTSAATEVSNAEALFFHVIGDRPLKELDPIEPEAVAIPTTLDELLDITLKQNPSLKKVDYDVKVAHNDKQLAFTNFSPQVSATAAFNRSSLTASSAETKNNNSYSIGVNIPIFQSGTEYVRVKQAKISERKSKWDYEETTNAVKESTIKVWNEYIKNKALLDSSNQAIAATQSALAGVIEEAKVGTRTTLDVLDAEQDLFQAKIQYKNAHSNYIQALFAMHQLMGTIDKLPVLKS